MDRIPQVGATSGGNAAIPISEMVESAAMTAHQVADRVADSVTLQVGRLSDTAHRGVNGVADVAKTAADWTSTIPEQAKQVQTRLAETACASVRARPLQTLAGAAVVGYLLGRLARL
jgi:hypothetical protein